MKTAKRIGIALILLLAIAYLGISYALSNRVLHPNRSFEHTKQVIEKYWHTTYDSVIKTFPEQEDFTVMTQDGIKLSTHYFSYSDSATCLIIFAHGWGTTWADMLKYVPLVEDCGCDLVFYDHRAHGESEGKNATGGILESKDLLALTAWLQETTGIERKNIGWVGSSWGAAAALMAGASEDNVGFIIADAPYQDWYSAIFERANREYGAAADFLSFGVMQTVNWRAGIDYKDANVLNAIEQVEEPILLLHSKDDNNTASFQSENIAKKMNKKSLFFLTTFGNNHVMDVINNKPEMKAIAHNFLYNIGWKCGAPVVKRKLSDIFQEAKQR